MRYPSIRAHAEVKLATMIRRRWEHTGDTPNATILINNEVCEGEMSCLEYLSRLLPPGCSITVITPTTRQTFTGEPT